MGGGHGRRTILALALICAPPAAVAAGKITESAAWRRLADDTGGTATVRVHPATGAARVVRLAPGRLRLDGAGPEERAHAFFARHGSLFGVRDSRTELRPPERLADRLGRVHLRFRQTWRGLPVFGAELRTHFDAEGHLALVHGTFVPDIALDRSPRRTVEDAGRAAIGLVGGADRSGLAVKNARLLVFRTGLVQKVEGENHLAWEIEVTGGADVRELVYVDAHTGKVLDRIRGIHSALSRRIHEPEFDNVVIWNEGDALPYVVGDADIDMQVNALLSSSADAYGLFLNLSAGGWPSWNGADATMHSVWNIPFSAGCPNAFWNGATTNFCYGFATDDVAAHEWTHAYTERTHGLIYQWQSGALNEAWSDIFGEMLDQLNGTGTDSPAVARTADSCSTFLAGSPPPTLAFLSSSLPTLRTGGAAFNPVGPLTVTAAVERANDGADDTADACEPLIGFTPGRIALIDRGNCAETTKVLHAQNAGAVGTVVVNVPGNYATLMRGSQPAITIPSAMIGNDEGAAIAGELPQGVTASLTLTPSVDESVRWLMGEDNFVLEPGAGRDLWNPTCFGDPGKVSDEEFYVCDDADSGGVHSNSGIPNHAFALLHDGGTYNGQTIAPLGATRLAHLYWRAMSVYQVEDSDFVDHADALEQSCADLIGVPLVDPVTGLPSGVSISAADCQEVEQALLAVEMRTYPAFCNFDTLLAPDAPAVDCGSVPLLEGFEDDPAATWTRTNFGVYAEYQARDWAFTSDLPPGHSGSAAFALDSRSIGDCMPGSDDQSGAMRLDSPEIVLDTNHARLTFDHWVSTELRWDGGNVSASVNGGPYQLIPSSAFTFNGYNTSLHSGGAGNTNPLAGQNAFSGTDAGTNGGSWGQSQVDLSSVATALDRVRLRFEFGVDGCNGVRGWYVDDVRICGDCSGSGGLDLDEDGFRSCDGDCREHDASVHPGASEVHDRQDNQCPGDPGFGVVDEISGPVGFAPGDPTLFSWSAQAGAEAYEVARATTRDFTTNCTTRITSTPSVVDTHVPESQDTFYYLVRPFFPYRGSWGTTSAGVERDVSCAASPATTVSAFSGGDAGEGLDFDGTFAYAVNVRGPGGFSIGDAAFTDDSAQGVYWSAQNDILDWSAPEYGDSADDDSLEVVMQSIRWSADPPTVNLSLDNLTLGARYKLQLLFYEQCCERGFDVFVDGALVVDDFSPYQVHGGVNPGGSGAVVTHEFTAGRSYVAIDLDGYAATFLDRNPILNGLTLELVGGGP